MKIETKITIGDNKESQVYNAYIFAILASAGAALLGIWAKLVYLSGIGPSEVIVGRSSFTVIFMGLYLLCNDKHLIKIMVKDLYKFIVLGVFGLALNFTCFLKAITFTKVSVVVALLFTYPSLVSIVSTLILKEKLNIRTIIALLVTLIGCLLTVGVYSAQNLNLGLQGILFGLGSSCATAFYTVYIKYLLKRYASLTILFWGFLCSSIMLIAINPGSFTKILKATLYSKMLLIVLAIVSTIMVYEFSAKAIKALGPIKTSIICTLEPVIAAIASFFILGETLAVPQWLGILLVVFGVVLIYSKKGVSPLDLQFNDFQD